MSGPKPVPLAVTENVAPVPAITVTSAGWVTICGATPEGTGAATVSRAAELVTLMPAPLTSTRSRSPSSASVVAEIV